MNVRAVRGWTEEDDAFLIKCIRDDGLTFGETETAFGLSKLGYRSRNSCIGRAERLGLKSAATKERAAGRIDRIRQACSPQRSRTRAPAAQIFAAAPSANELSPLARVTASDAPHSSIEAKIDHAIKRSRSNLGLMKDSRPLRCDPVEPRRVDLLDLEPNDCRWPAGGWPSADPITFCGHPVEPGCSYCPEHKALNTGRGTYGEVNAHRINRAQVAA